MLARSCRLPESSESFYISQRWCLWIIPECYWSDFAYRTSTLSSDTILLGSEPQNTDNLILHRILYWLVSQKVHLARDACKKLQTSWRLGFVLYFTEMMFMDRSRVLLKRFRVSRLNSEFSLDIFGLRTPPTNRSNPMVSYWLANTGFEWIFMDIVG